MATFPYKTALPEANVKTNGMESTKCTYQKERVSPVKSLLNVPPTPPYLKVLFPCEYP